MSEEWPKQINDSKGNTCKAAAVRKHVGYKWKYRFLVEEPLDPADRDRSSSANRLASSLPHFSSEPTTDPLWRGDCRSQLLGIGNEYGALVIRSPPMTRRLVISELLLLVGKKSFWEQGLETCFHSLQLYSSRRA